MLRQLVCLSLIALALGQDDRLYTSQQIVDYVNTAQKSWTAASSKRFENMPLSVIRGMMGAWRSADRPKPNPSYVAPKALPSTFDARVAWPMCAEVIGNIRDQSACGSCWAVAAAGAMSDRMCIASNATFKDSLSATDLMSCCRGFFGCGDGCQGGYPDKAWAYFDSTGIVTGGNYTNKAGCKPYAFPPCEHHISGGSYGPCPSQIYNTPKCVKSCQAGYTANPYENDKRKGATVVRSATVAEIQTELMTHGSMEMAFDVYEDFLTYKSGVYQHTTGEFLGGHAVRVLGWGVENNTPYWLIANSWNSDWGDHGYFKMIRGTDNCGIEDDVVAGIPK